MAFNENSRVKIPALLHLMKLGYTYIPLREQIRREDTNIFESIFLESLQKINPSAQQEELKRVLDEVSLELDYEDIGEKFYQRLTATSGIKLIDFKNFNNNSFHVTTELICKNGDEEFRPDITLLVNGMPLAFVEVKKPHNKEGVLAERRRINTRFKQKQFRKFANATQLMVFSNNMEYEDGIVEPVFGAFYATSAYTDLHFNYFREDADYPVKQELLVLSDEQENFVLKDNNLLVIKHSPEFKTNKEPNIVIEVSGGSPNQSTGRVAYVDGIFDNIICSNFCRAFKIKNDYSSKYFYYLLKNIYDADIFFNFESKTTGIKNLLIDVALDSIKVPKIELDTQLKIASVLSALDDKIELNNKINAELEQMAKTLYDYWFVQFDFPNEEGKPYKSSGGKTVYNEVLKREIPEGWEVQVFSDWIKETKAGDWGKDIEEGNYTERVYCVRGADINGLNGKGEVKAPQRFILKNNLSKALKSNDFIIEISGGSPTQSTGRIALLTNKTFRRFDTNVICSNFCKAISLKDEKYIFNFHQEWQRLYDAGVFFGYEGKTSGIKNFLFDSFITSYKVVLPPKEIVEQYYNVVQHLEGKKQINLQQNQELAQLRDWLLPMLMNGQVKVSDNYSSDNDEHSIVIPKEMDLAAEPTIGYQKLEPFATNESLEIDPRFESWLAHQGLAARDDIDTETLREIFDAMDDEDK